jgi:uncharacterized protein YegP (UPF0339 family)
MKVIIYEDAAGGWRWHAIAANGEIVADSSEAYTERNDCREAVHRLAAAFTEGITIETK